MNNTKKCLIINPETGMAGDMFCAALVSLGADSAAVIGGMEEAARSIGRIRITAVHETRMELEGIRLNIETGDHLPGLEAGKARSHLKSILENLRIASPYSDYAEKALAILIHAEEDAHKNHPGLHHHDGETHLHEAQDILLDITGSAIALQDLGIDLSGILCLSPVFAGGGTVRFSHGTLAVPAPATASIIESSGIPFQKGPVDRELLTPTGASLLAALSPVYTGRAAWLEKYRPGNGKPGAGFGSLDISRETGKPNALTLYLTGTL
ncbi:MAG: DUF111 family protein [Spirochaetales bacterium]|nr:DUF111 family protein [Spirochaetales bacterium]